MQKSRGTERSRSTHVRTKIVALLAALAALWAFAAVVTIRDGLNVLFVSTVDRNVARPTELLFNALQQERRLSSVAVSGSADIAAELAASRARTNEQLAQWRSSVASTSLGVAASQELRDRIAETDRRLDALGPLRAGVDDGSMERGEVVAGFTAIIDAGYTMYGALTLIDDQEIARQVTNLLALARAREVLLQQDALLAGILTEGRFDEQELAEVTKLIGTQRFIYDTMSNELPPADYALYQELVTEPSVVGLRRLEDLIIAQARPGGEAPISAQEWQEAVTPATAAIRGWELATADNILERATPAAIGVVVRLLLAGVLGLIAVLAAVIISITTARALVRQLERLRDAARELARNRLPKVVERLSAGEQVDVAAEAPPLRFGDDEIGQVGQAFNQVQETAVRAAVQQAELRRGVRDVFLSLARRTQNLVHKQLGVVDGMERRETDADEMEELYRIDHLATRMRRNAENLIVLSGASPGRTWRQPVSMIDVVRGAVAEVEEYTRVSLVPVEAAALEGRAVGDVIHLLAELIENAAAFSPPYARVGVGGQLVAHGFVVEIEDRGLGMTEEELATANAKLANPPDFSLADASRLGHYVVAKLAQRHGIRVHLRPSPYGGIVAIVLLPAGILSETDAGGPPALPARPPTPDSGASAPAPEPAADAGTPGPEPTVAVVRQRRGDEEPPRPTPRHGETRHREPPAEVRTPSGLPWRVRQASLPEQLGDGNGDGGREPAARMVADLGELAPVDEPLARDPEQVRRMMRSYQHGTQRGRTDAEDPPRPPAAGQQPGDSSGPEG